jgi:hypothetical protein
MRGFAVEDFQNWMVIALGARVSEDGEGAKGSLNETLRAYVREVASRKVEYQVALFAASGH